MKITLNGKSDEIREGRVSVTKLLEIKKVEMPEVVTVERNGEILEREKFPSTIVEEGDKIELLYFMGGGRK